MSHAKDDEPEDPALDALLTRGLAQDPEAEERIVKNVTEVLRDDPEALAHPRSALGLQIRLALAAAVVLAATLGLFFVLLTRGTSEDKDGGRHATPAVASEDQGTHPVAYTPRAGETEWEGYLYTTPKGDLLVGWNLPYICQTEMSQSKSIPKQYAADLAPFLSKVSDDMFMWVHSGLPKPDAPAAAFDAVPRYLVRIAGMVKDPPGQWPQMGATTTSMTAPRVVEAEFLSEAWLRAWGGLVATGYYPKIESLAHPPRERNDDENRALAPKVLDALLAMRKASAIGSEWRGTLARVAPGARAVNRFEREVEIDVHRWLADLNNRLNTGLDLTPLGALPPDASQLYRWFREAPSKQAFLDHVRAVWKDDLDSLYFACFRDQAPGGTNTVREETSVLRVRSWSEAEFKACQEATKREDPPHQQEAATQIEAPRQTHEPRQSDEETPKPQDDPRQGERQPVFGEASNGVALSIEVASNRLRQSRPGTPIPVRLTAKNTGEVALKLPHAVLWPAYLRVVLKDAAGKELALTEEGKKSFDPKVTAVGKVGPPNLPLPPNSTISSFGSLNLAALFDLSKPGRYEVQVIYEETDGEGWHGKAVSNVVPFEVLEK